MRRQIVVSRTASSMPVCGMRVMRPSFVSLMMRPTAPPIWLGIVVAASLLVLETVAVVYLKQLTGQPFGTLYMVDVLVVSTVWGFGLSAFTSVVTALAYTYFRNWPHTHFGPWELGFWLSIGVFLFVALLANLIAAVARTGERFSELSSDLLAIVGHGPIYPGEPRVRAHPWLFQRRNDVTALDQPRRARGSRPCALDVGRFRRQHRADAI